MYDAILIFFHASTWLNAFILLPYNKKTEKALSAQFNSIESSIA